VRKQWLVLDQKHFFQRGSVVMKQWMTVMVLCAALLAPAVARAHEGHLHKALGTVSAIDGQHVTIKTTDGKSVMVMLDNKTTVTQGTKKLDAAALKIGQRVSVDYMDEKDMKMAHAIKLAAAPAQAKK
jgi:hypothetical protein